MSLTTNYTFVGKGNWSIDGIGGQTTGGGDLSAIVPLGSQIEAAFLYASTYSSGSISSVKLTEGADSKVVTTFAALGTTSGLQAFRADITDFVDDAIGNGSASTLTFNLSTISGSSVDGFGLVIVYSNPTESTRTISLLDGFSANAGDSFGLGFAAPVNTAQAGFEAQMSLGIGFSAANGQYSNILVDGRPLTSSAGGYDDGVLNNGGLLTIGGIGDETTNPVPTGQGPTRMDDELYDLAKGNSVNAAPFLANGATGITVLTSNPSNDDNIFFAGFNITAVVAVDTSENDAPIAVGDAVAVNENGTITFNALANDFDPDAADDISLFSVNTAGLKGLLTNNGDGTFKYDPNGEFDYLGEGDTAVTSFKYTISDGEETATATVTITVSGKGDSTEEPPPAPNDCPTVDRPGTQDGSAATNDVLTGPAWHNTFYFDTTANIGKDRITNFGKDDILVVTQKIADSNNDDIITFGSNGLLNLDGTKSSKNTVKFDGLDPKSGLRYLGEACEGVFVYADAAVKPKGAIEGKLSDDVLAGDLTDAKKNAFFFDTALDIHLGDDRIDNFGAKDILVTTTALSDSNKNKVVSFGPNKLIDLSGGVGGPLDPGLPGEVGTIAVYGVGGAQVTSLESDGSVTHNGVTYYVYSLVGSAAGLADLAF